MPAAPLTDAERAALRELVAVERARAQRRLSSLERTFDEMVDAADLEPPDEHDPDGTVRAPIWTSVAGALATAEPIPAPVGTPDLPGPERRGRR